MIKYDGIIFDMDGTIWDTREAVCNSWNEAFRCHNIDRQIYSEELTGYMGMPMDMIAAKVFPDKTREECIELLGYGVDNENKYLAKNGAIIYPKLKETIAELSKKINLYIVSNCQSGYIEAFFKAYDTSKYFKDFECYGNTGLLKADNIKLLIKRNALVKPVYIGDTQIDADSAKEAGTDFIFAGYGFGNVNKDCCRIDSFSDILRIIL